MTNWQTKSSEVVYETPWIKVRRDEVLNHNHKPMTYSVVELKVPTVMVVAEQDGHILVQQSYHYTIDQTHWEIPAGGADETNLEKAAKRELLEETGFASDNWTQLGRYYHAIGMGNLPYYVFLARAVRKTREATDEHEEIRQQKFVTYTEAEKMIIDGDIIEGAHISAIYMAKLHLQKEGYEF